MSYHNLFNKWRAFLVEQAFPPQDTTGVSAGAKTVTRKDVEIPSELVPYDEEEQERRAEEERRRREEEERRAEKERKRREEEEKEEEEKEEDDTGSPGDGGEINGGKPLVIVPDSGRKYGSYNQGLNVEPGIVNSVQIHELLKGVFKPLDSGQLRKNCGWGHPMTAKVLLDAHEATKAFNEENRPVPLVGNISRRNGGPLWRNDEVQYYYKDIPKSKVTRKKKTVTVFDKKWTQDDVTRLNLPANYVGKTARKPTFSTSHQQGIDIDLGFYQLTNQKWITFNSLGQFNDHFDLNRNVAFLHALCLDDRVHRIFFDSKCLKWMDETIMRGAQRFIPRSMQMDFPGIELQPAGDEDSSGDDYSTLAEHLSTDTPTIQKEIKWWQVYYDSELENLAETSQIQLPSIFLARYKKKLLPGQEGDSNNYSTTVDGSHANQWFATVDQDTPDTLNVRPGQVPLDFSKIKDNLYDYIANGAKETTGPKDYTWMNTQGRQLTLGNAGVSDVLGQILDKIKKGLDDLLDPDAGTGTDNTEVADSETKETWADTVSLTNMWKEISKCIQSGKIKHEKGHNNHYHIRLHYNKVQNMTISRYRKELAKRKTTTQGASVEGVKVSNLVTSKTFIENSKFKDQFGFVFGTVDGTILHQHNADKRFKGASMQKLLAIIYNFDQARQGIGRKLTDKEQQNLIAYQKHGGEGIKGYNKKTGISPAYTIEDGKGDSNHVMRKLYGSKGRASWGPWVVWNGKDEQGVELSALNKDASGKLQRRLKIKSTTKPQAGGNYQTCKDIFKILAMLSESEYVKGNVLNQEDANQIMNLMRRKDSRVKDNDGETVGFKWDRETSGIKKLVKAANKESKKNSTGTPYIIRKAFGKGGYDPPSFAYGIIIDDKYIFSIYTNFKNLKSTKKQPKKEEDRLKYDEDVRFTYHKEGIREVMGKILADVLGTIQ